MATQHECAAALQDLAARFATLDPAVRRRHAGDRTLSCSVPDLAVVCSVRVCDGSVVELDCRPEDHAVAPAQVRLTASSDDLVALVGGDLLPPVA